MSDEKNKTEEATEDKQIELKIDPKTVGFSINGSRVEGLSDSGHIRPLARPVSVGNIAIHRDKKTGEFTVRLTE